MNGGTMALNISEHAMEEYQRIMTFVRLLIVLVLLAITALVLIQPVHAAGGIPFNETIAGERNLGQWFTWTAWNVSMNADSVYHYTVYEWREIGPKYHYYSVNWGQWFEEPAGQDQKFFAIWIRGWLEGTAWHGWGPDRFRLWVGNRSYEPEPVKLQDIPLRNIGKAIVSTVKEGCKEKEVITGYSGGALETGRYLPVVIQELENLKARNSRGQLTTERYGWMDENELVRMDPGESNAYDGVLLYRVPKDAQPEDMMVSGSFWSWGPSWWYLTDRDIVQDSEEKTHFIDQIVIEMQKDQGIRLPDIMPERMMA